MQIHQAMIYYLLSQWPILLRLVADMRVYLGIHMPFFDPTFQPMNLDREDQPVHLKLFKLIELLILQ